MGVLMTPPVAAKRLGVGVSNIRQYIERQELTAINTSLGSCKPRWKIAEEDLQRFIESRKSGNKPVPVRQRRRRKTDEAIPQYV